MRHGARWFWVILLAVTLAAVALGIRRFVAPRIVGRAVSPTGVEMCVVQQFNWGAEPFTTSFVFRRPGGGPWGWCYFDHEDWHWGSSTAVLDTNAKSATFLRDGKPVLSFDWEDEIYRRGNRIWSTGAQRYFGPEWKPGDSVYR